MTISSTMHRTEPCLGLFENDTENKQPTSTISNLFSYSIHNCLCKTTKTGLILYPKDIQDKNVILLVCEQCYNYQMENGMQHSQLEKWYFNIYKDSKSFHFKSKFLQNTDGSLCFDSTVLNTDYPLSIKEREIENWEKEAIQQLVQRKHR